VCEVLFVTAVTWVLKFGLSFTYPFYIHVGKILSKFGSESLETINTKHLFLQQGDKSAETYQEAGPELKK